MIFNFKLMLRLVGKSFAADSRSGAALRPKRLLAILIVFSAYALIETVNWICLLLDDVFYRKYRSVAVREPFFIAGIPRSGTTFLHRLLALDKRFTTMRLWEVVFAPSIIQKKLFMRAASADARLGSPVRRLVSRFERWFFKHNNHIHKMSFFAAEEDELLLLHIFSSLFLIIMFPFESEMKPYYYFDDAIEAGQRLRIMRFYKQCVQRHLYVFGRGKRFLSKNPVFTPKLRTLREVFPDGKMLCMFRSPYDVLPSINSLADCFLGLFGTEEKQTGIHDWLYEGILHWYRCPLALLETWPSGLIQKMCYETLVRNPREEVCTLYKAFGMNVSDDFDSALRAENERSRSYKSRHSYSIQDIGVAPEKIRADFKPILDRLGIELRDDQAELSA